MIQLRDLFPNRTRYYKPITVIYYVIIIISTYILHKSIESPIANILTGINSICLLLAIHPKFKLKYKYMLSTIGFICIYVPLLYFQIDLNSISFAMFYWPLLYAYLLPDVLSPIIIAALSGTIFLKYVDIYSNQEVIGRIMGIFSSATLFSVVSFLMDRLYDSREMYKELSVRDSLTGLYNLSYIIKIGEELLESGNSIVVLIFDIDHFKVFNDTYGYIVGNDVLIRVSEKIDKTVKELEGISGRLGGDEFVAIIPNLKLDKLNKLYHDLFELFNWMKIISDPELDPVEISISIGMSHSEKSKRNSIKDLLNIADMNMYYHKKTKLFPFTFIEKDILSEKEKHLLKLLSEKDMYSYVHSKYVARYTDWIVQSLGYEENERNDILRGAWLHDIGKLFVSNDILRKSGKLTDQEYNVIKEHVNIGLKIVNEFDISEKGINCIKYHHERYDGLGYPYGLKGVEVPLEGRILQIADAFSAMTIKRVYRKIFDIDDAISELIRNKGSQFDPEIVDIFIKIINSKIKK